MIEFAYNNVKNANIGHITLKLNYNYYFWMSCKKDFNFYLKSNSADGLLAELRKLIIIYKKNLYHSQKLQKQIYNKDVKSKNNTFGNKI